MSTLCKRALCILIVVAILVVVALALKTWDADQHKEVRVTSMSPDRRFTGIVYRLSDNQIRMPCQSGDAQGQICLSEARTGRVLKRLRLEMVQLVGFHDIEWTATNVYIKLFADWKLPSP